MADRPPCYGNFSAHHTQPCARCTVSGPCSSKTQSAGFGILHHPRLTRDVTRAVELPTTDAIPAIIDAFTKELSTSGMVFDGDWCRTGARRRRVAKITVLASRAIVATFRGVFAAQVASLPSAAHVDVRPLRTMKDHGKGQVTMTTEGSKAVSLSPVATARLVIDVARVVFGGVYE